MKLTNTTFLIFSCVGMSAGDQLVAPTGLENNFGNGIASAPLDILPGASVRYQQVYSATEFAHTGIDAFLITGLRFRPTKLEPREIPPCPCGGAFSSILPDIQFNMSTTLAGPDSLSANFSENLGLDDTIVYSRGLLSLRSIGGVGPHVFDISVNFSTPFLYLPANGNLLLDIRNYSGGETTFIDAQSVFGDSISSVRAHTGEDTGSVNSQSGFIATGGLTTMFEFTPIPEPSALALFAIASAVLIWFRPHSSQRLTHHVPSRRPAT